MLNKHTARNKPFPREVLGLRVRFAKLPNGIKSPNPHFQFVILPLLGIFKRQGSQKKGNENQGKARINTTVLQARNQGIERLNDLHSVTLEI